MKIEIAEEAVLSLLEACSRMKGSIVSLEALLAVAGEAAQREGEKRELRRRIESLYAATGPGRSFVEAIKEAKAALAALEGLPN